MKTEDLLTKVRERIALGSGTAFEKELADALVTSEAGAAAAKVPLARFMMWQATVDELLPDGLFDLARAALSSTAGAEILERLTLTEKSERQALEAYDAAMKTVMDLGAMLLKAEGERDAALNAIRNWPDPDGLLAERDRLRKLCVETADLLEIDEVGSDGWLLAHKLKEAAR